MNKRSSKRIPVRLEAYIFSGEKTYMGFIDNVSEGGFQYLIVTTIQAPKDFKPEKIIQLLFQIPSGETLKLFCKVKWYLKSSTDKKPATLGIEIIDPSSKFKEFIKTLDIVTVN
jgi:hypothetical protein